MRGTPVSLSSRFESIGIQVHCGNLSVPLYLIEEEKERI
jgi:hypothetical protein